MLHTYTTEDELIETMYAYHRSAVKKPNLSSSASGLQVCNLAVMGSGWQHMKVKQHSLRARSGGRKAMASKSSLGRVRRPLSTLRAEGKPHSRIRLGKEYGERSESILGLTLRKGQLVS